jgi:hypothetical protein
LIKRGKKGDMLRMVAKKKLKTQIVIYMNRWITIIRRSTGRPNIVEEYTTFEVFPGGTVELLANRFIVRSPTDFEAAYRMFTFFLVDSPKKACNPANIWLNHHLAKQADQITFDPDPKSKVKISNFNLFRGLGITREMAAKSMIGETKTVEELTAPVTEHIRNIWCKKERKSGTYMLKWSSHLVQRPHIKMVTTPVLKGGQGAGKGIIIQHFLGQILGYEHFLSATSLDAITGTFQEEKVKTNLLTFLDEATFAGDKRQSSILKGLLSEATRKWEAKFINAISIRNFSNYIVASNYEQSVCVESDDRRWLCLEVDSKYAGPQTAASKEYFDNILNVNVLHFAHLLYTMDLSDFNPRSAPSSSYQRYQKLINFDSVTHWIEHVLHDDELHIQQKYEERSKNGLTPGLSHVQAHIQASIYDDYVHYCSQPSMKYKQCVSDKRFWKATRGILYGITDGERTNRDHFQKRTVLFPDIKTCREQFASHVFEPEWNWN